MAQHLDIEIMHLKGRVVDVTHGTFEEEKAVVVDLFLAQVEAEERGDVGAGVVVDELAGVEIEVLHVEGIGCSEVRDAHTEVAEFVDGRGSCGEGRRSELWSGGDIDEYWRKGGGDIPFLKRCVLLTGRFFSPGCP